MYKIIPILIVSILVLGGLGAVANHENEETAIEHKLTFSKPFIEINDQDISISIEGANTVINQPNKPILPVCEKTFIFPIGTKIIDVDVNLQSQIHEQKLTKNVKLASEPLTPDLTTSVKISNSQKNEIKSSSELYPNSWFDYDIGCGLIQGKRSIIVTTQFYPVRIEEDNLFYITNAEIKISYKKPTEPVFPAKSDYDLLIITPEKFSAALDSFVSHKESKNILTKLVTTEEIYDGTYFDVEGRDDAEKVKYFIKNALDNWGITYVLLVGGLKPLTNEEWFVPVRYAHVFWGDEYRYVSDLYFADIYDGEMNFSTWDTDENDVFSEWPKIGGLKDDLDLYPDVLVGRWACKTKFELNAIIKKTIKFENNNPNDKIVLVGGDNFEQAGYEGEIVCDKTMTYLPGYDSEKIYSSEKTVNAKNIKSALGLIGAKWMHFHGHGSPTSFSTHKPDNFDEWEPGFGVEHYLFLFNIQTPIVIYGGCHTAMFNISILNHPWNYYPYPYDLSWNMVNKRFGGAVSAFAYTAFPVATPGETGDLDGDGINEPDCVESGYGYMQLGLFEGYGDENYEHLGQCLGYTVSRYIEKYKLPLERYHLHTIQAFVLLGDPSLKIDG